MERFDIEIIERYEGLKPSVSARKTVERALRVPPRRDLAGLRRIVLTTGASQSRADRRASVRSRGHEVTQEQALGHYRAAALDSPATITVFVDKVRDGNPILLAFVLYHELGHHVQATVRDPRRQREAFADAYAERMIARSLRAPRFILPLLARALMRAPRRPLQFIKGVVTWLTFSRRMDDLRKARKKRPPEPGPKVQHP